MTNKLNTLLQEKLGDAEYLASFVEELTGVHSIKNLDDREKLLNEISDNPIRHLGTYLNSSSNILDFKLRGVQRFVENLDCQQAPQQLLFTRPEWDNFVEKIVTVVDPEN